MMKRCMFCGELAACLAVVAFPVYCGRECVNAHLAVGLFMDTAPATFISGTTWRSYHPRIHVQWGEKVWTVQL